MSETPNAFEQAAGFAPGRSQRSVTEPARSRIPSGIGTLLNGSSRRRDAPASSVKDSAGKEEALEQVELSGYARPYAGDSRTLHKIGAVFSTKTRTLSDWREVLG